MSLTLVTLSERPDLADQVGRWQWQEWGAPRGRTLQSVLHDVAALAATTDEVGFVLLDGDEAVGTACLTLTDLDARPDLSPWLASVYVPPAQRGRGHATRLVRAVEQAAAARGHAELFLFTWDTAPLYRRLGWLDLGTERHHGESVTLMRRALPRETRV